MGKKKRTNKEKNIIPTRSKKERQEEVRKIILSLTTYQLTTEYAEVQELFKLLQIYINTGERQEINIPFPISNFILDLLLDILIFLLFCSSNKIS